MARKILDGLVVGVSGEKSILVSVSRKYADKKYGKIVIRHKKYMAHDESKACTIGDTVTIQECRPMSKSKRFTVINKKN